MLTLTSVFLFYLSIYICACSKSQGVDEEEWVEVTHDYTAQKDDELTLRVGDTIQGTGGGQSELWIDEYFFTPNLYWDRIPYLL